MARRGYGQICGVSHALEVVGERWALLIVRDLINGPKRFTDLRQGLPRIPTNVLSARLKELEQADVLQRRILPRPASAVVYELTDYGRELEDILLALGRWGARLMGPPDSDEVFTVGALSMAMRAVYRSEGEDSQEAAEPVNYELRIGEVVLGLTVQDGQLSIVEGPQPKPDLVIHAQECFTSLLTGKVSPSEALASGSVQVTGDPELLTQFARSFQA